MRAVLVLLAVAALAGCFGAAPAGPGNSGTPSAGASTSVVPPVTTAPAPLPSAPAVDYLLGFSFEGCRGLSVQQHQPVADIQAILPHGFTAAQSPTFPGVGLVGLDLYACGNLTVGGQPRIADTYFGEIYTIVEQPTARVPGAPAADRQEYAFRILAGEDVLSVLWAKAGYDTRSGVANVSVGAPVGGPFPSDPGFRSGMGSVGADYYLLATASRTVAPAKTSSTFARYSALADGSVLVWTGTYEFPRESDGGGVFQVAADDAFAAFAHGKYLNGQSRVLEGARIGAQDLRRVFTPPA